MQLVRLFLILLLASFASHVCAASLQVFPVQLDVAAPAAASKLTLRNIGGASLKAQIRIFLWRQVDGKDELVETRDVIASPPFANVAPSAQQLVRIVRVSKAPIDHEETYRLLVDEIPDSSGSSGSGVKFAVRYSIPVFFSNAPPRRSPLVWTVNRRGGSLMVSAHNAAGRRVRVAGLKVAIAGTEPVSFGEGLTGYVLANSDATWSAKVSTNRGKAGSRVTISAETDNGPEQATAELHILP